MGSVGVVVVDVVDDQSFELTLVPDDGPVEKLATQGADPTFRVRVGDRGPHRTPDDLDVVAAEDLIEGVAELAATIAHQRTGTDEQVTMTNRQVAGGLSASGAGRVGGDPAEEHDTWAPLVLRIFDTVEAARWWWPRPTSSPWMRRYPHVGLSVAISITSQRITIVVAGLPGRRGG
jgi:hypothetical protein